MSAIDKWTMLSSLCNLALLYAAMWYERRGKEALNESLVNYDASERVLERYQDSLRDME
jgi:hypothetical protein